MPFRQLPRSDSDRLQALEAAAAKAAAVDPADLAFSAATKATLDASLPQFRNELQERGTATGAQVAATAALATQRERLRLWLSHFFQNLNFAIARGVFQAPDRTFYQLPASQESLPAMSTEADLLMWSQRAVDGEAARVAAGGAPMPFPKAADIGVERAAYVALQAEQSTKLDAANAEQEDVEALREPVDELIADIWDEVEFTFRKDAPPSLRAKAREYGVVYVSRPNEPSEPGPTLAAPTGLLASAGMAGDVSATWNAVAGAVEYVVEQLEVGVDPDFTLAGTTDQTSLSFGNYSSGTTVQVRVRARSQVGSGGPESPNSAVAEAAFA